MAGNSKTEKVELHAPALEELCGGKYPPEIMSFETNALHTMEMSMKTELNKLVSNFSAASRTGGQFC